MIALIEKLLGISVPRWVVEAVAIAALALGAVLYLEHRGATHELAKLQRSSTTLIAKARRQIAQDAAQYSSAQKANQEKLHEALAANSALQSDLAQRVRDFDAYRRAHPNVPRATGGPVAAGSGAGSAVDFGAIALRLAERGNELAGSVGELRASLQACERDRDSLTGLPR